MEPKDFGYALRCLKVGLKLTRRGWNAPGQYVEMQRPTVSSKMSEPYCYLKNAQDGRVPWVPSQGDLFAEDWELAEA